MTINLDVNTLKKYWLSISATVAGLWYSLSPTAQQQVIAYVSKIVHGYPKFSAAIGVITIILVDLKQSPLAVAPAPPSAK